MAGIAHPILLAAKKSAEEVKETLQIVIEGIRNSMFLVGAESISELKEVPLVITGKAAEWLKSRGFKPDIYAKRTLRKGR